MNWITIIYDCWDIFMFFFTIFVIWSLVEWVVRRRQQITGLRDWLGASAMTAGTISAALFAFFFVFFWVQHRLIAHGSVLAIYFFTGEALALLGLALGLAAHGWLRQTSTLISLVMVFEWYGRMIVGMKTEALLTVAMFISVAIWIAIVSAIRWVTRSRAC